MLRGHLSAIGQQHDSRVRLLEETDETDKLNGVHQTLLSLSGSRLRLWRHEEKTDISLRFRASASREKNAAIGRGKSLVEAAGVEPASENSGSPAPTCVSLLLILVHGLPGERG